jgi:hypothetical protein
MNFNSFVMMLTLEPSLKRMFSMMFLPTWTQIITMQLLITLTTNVMIVVRGVNTNYSRGNNFVGRYYS